MGAWAMPWNLIFVALVAALPDPEDRQILEAML